MVKLSSSGTLYVVNQASPVTVPDSPALDADRRVRQPHPGDQRLRRRHARRTPNVACPPLLAWANFMSAGEAIVIYPDHESLGTLANVTGSSSSASTGPAAR